MATLLGRADVGQTVVVKNGHVLALEAVEGTDACIRRGGELGGPGVVVVKRSKPDQDQRFDLPAVGPGTIEVLREVGARVLAIEAGKTLLLEGDRLLALANEAGITLVAAIRQDVMAGGPICSWRTATGGAHGPCPDRTACANSPRSRGARAS